MNLLDICESLAAHATEYGDAAQSEDRISDSDIDHWQRLFKITRPEAIHKIQNWRADLGRTPLSQAAWDAIKGSDFARGFTKESYEYSLTRKSGHENTSVSGTYSTQMHLLRIREPLLSLDMVQSCLGTEEFEVLPGFDDDHEPVQFCYMTTQQKNVLQNRLTIPLTIIPVKIAAKTLSKYSRYPTLGVDPTLPQHRARAHTERFEPTQDEFPVRYFFYGTLADRAVLARILCISNEDSIQFEPAVVSGAVMSSWGNKYRGLIDGDQSAQVHGKAYMVKSREEEEALRIYETNNYEVVRCNMVLQLDRKAYVGLTFRLTQSASPPAGFPIPRTAS